MTHNNNYQKIRIFVASPGDVSVERARLATVIEGLNHGLADYFGLVLEMKEWYQVAPDMGRAEQIILTQMPVDSWDVFIGILWLRFGTPTGGTDPKTGQNFSAGTEEEFKLAYQSWRETRKPRIMFYRCTRAPANMLGFDFAQAARVEQFFSSFDATEGKTPGLYKTFDTPDKFQQYVREHLEKFLIEYREKVQGNTVSPEVKRLYAPDIPNTLPRRVPFFGRRDEIKQALRALSPEDRGWGIVIDGIGGIGKTALAVEVAYLCKEEKLFDAFIFATAKGDRLTPTGIQKINLTAASLDELIDEAARGLGQPGIAHLSSGQDKQRALLNMLSGKRALIIFDNLEAMPISDQTAVGEFLRNLPPECKAIITSRRRSGEAAVTLRLEKLKMEEAWELIRDQMEKHGTVKRALTQAGEDAWKQLYDETGGSPLALLWTVGLIHARGWSFNRGLELLREGNAKSDLNEFIYGAARNTMDANERVTLGALSFFGGPSTFEALAATANLDRHSLDSVLERLRALSLINVAEESDGQDLLEERYTLHPLTRRFARADLETEVDAASAMGIRFTKYWLNYCTQYGSSAEKSSFERLETEWANLNATVSWLWEVAGVERDKVITNADAARMIKTLAESLDTFLLFSGRWEERRQLNMMAYEVARVLREWQGAGWRSYQVAFDYYNCRQTKEAEVWLNKSDASWRLIAGTKVERATSTRMRGLIAMQSGNHTEAELLLSEALSIWYELKRDRLASNTLSDLGYLHYQRLLFDKAEVFYRKALDLALRSNYKVGQAAVSGNLGLLAVSLGKWPEAHEWFEQELALARELGRVDLIASAQCGLARMHKGEGREDLAIPLAKEALSIYERLQHRRLSEVRKLLENIRGALPQQDTA